jgi:hypothetical protein
MRHGLYRRVFLPAEVAELDELADDEAVNRGRQIIQSARGGD